MTPLIVQTSNDNPSSQYVNYWIVDGDTISNSIDTTFIFTQYGTYVIKHCLWDPQFECGHCHDVTIIADPNPALEVPNVFTPNGDGMNDFFIPAEIRDLDLIEIQVHSRNGPLIWQSSDYPFRWDGMTQNGTPCPDGVYFWTLRYREALSSNYIFLNGTVTLVR
jgi:gliding motility-associated-like protein